MLQVHHLSFHFPVPLTSPGRASHRFCWALSLAINKAYISGLTQPDLFKYFIPSLLNQNKADSYLNTCDHWKSTVPTKDFHSQHLRRGFYLLVQQGESLPA